jgi:hypothetical protein
VIELRPTTIVVLAAGIALSVMLCARDPESTAPTLGSISQLGRALAGRDGYVMTGFESQFP